MLADTRPVVAPGFPGAGDTPSANDTTVVVVGGGISGLAAAWALHQRGVAVTLFEAKDRVGGVIASEERDGRIVELGPQSMQVTDTVATLIDQLSLSPALQPASPSGRRRYIASGGQLYRAPMSPFALAATPLLSLRAKLRLLREPFVARSSEADETIASFIERRLGPEPLAMLATPFVRGVWAGDPAVLSARLAMAKVVRLEQDYGSLTRGALRNLLGGRRARATQPPRLRGPTSFRGGMAQLPTTMAMALGRRVVCNASVRAITGTRSGWVIDVDYRDAGRERIRAAHVIIATPAYAVPKIADPRVDELALDAIATTEYASVTTVTLGFRRSEVAHRLDGFGVLVADREPRVLLGALFTSAMFAGRCPNDEVLITCFVGGPAARTLATMATSSLVPLLENDLRSLIGVRGAPTFVSRTSWASAIPQYTCGHARVIEATDRIEAACEQITFAGNWRTGVSIGDCIAGAVSAASRAHSSVGHR